MKKSIIVYLIILLQLNTFAEKYTFGPNQLSIEIPKNFSVVTLGKKDDGVDRFSANSKDGKYIGVNGCEKNDFFAYSTYKGTTSSEVKEGATKQVYKAWTTTQRKVLIQDVEKFTLTAVKETKKLIVVVAYMSKVNGSSTKAAQTELKKILDSIVTP